jgi:hypothetical protein
MNRIFSFIILVCILFGCATVGGPFPYQNKQNIVIGKTTKDEGIQLFGSPFGTTKTSNANGNFSILKYAYANGGGSRVLIIEFKDNVLNAYIYVSSFEEDSTKFDYAVGKTIKEGSFNKAVVLKKMGKPAGKALCPSTMGDFKQLCHTEKEVWKWAFGSKHLNIAFNKNGIVSLIKSSED